MMAKRIFLSLLIFSVCVSITSCGRKKEVKKATREEVSQSFPNILDSTQKHSVKVLSSMTYGRDDPFAPVMDASNNSKRDNNMFELEGTILSGSQSLAIINGVIVEVGDKTPIGTVFMIKNGYVVIKNGDQKRILQLEGFKFTATK